MVRKSDGGFGYGTTDMATLKQRIQVCFRLLHPLNWLCAAWISALCIALLCVR